MKIKISSVSGRFEHKSANIEANSIDEAIKILQTDKELVQSVINNQNSDLFNGKLQTPNYFCICYTKDGIEIELYDDYRE